jgi:hypothetical protein
VIVTLVPVTIGWAGEAEIESDALSERTVNGCAAVAVAEAPDEGASQLQNRKLPVEAKV